MRTLTIDLPEELYEVFAQTASQEGRTVKEIAIEWLAKHGPKSQPRLSEEASQAAWERLLRHAGSVDSGDPHSGDNDRIDADLEREYANNHEEKP
jgi:hypothetical protein